MRQTKYMMSGGLAFSEEKDMEKLRRYSLKGWHVTDFKFMGYRLEKGESADYIYSVDYRSLKEDEAEEYVDFFSSAGWSHITSEGNTHLFRATPGTKPIYSDNDTVAVKHDNLGSSLKWTAITLTILTALLWIGTLISSGTLQTVLAVTAIVLGVVTVPADWTVLTIYKNKWEAEGAKHLANLAKAIPLLFLLGVAGFILFIGGTSDSIRILSSMIIGGIALPTIILILMSLLNKFKGNKA